MGNLIENNATKILEYLFENNPEQNLQFDGKDLSEALKLSPVEINNSIDYLDDRGLLERHNWMGTIPFNFGAVYLNSRGNYIYHQLQNAHETRENNVSSNIVSIQPLAAGSPYGFTDIDWEYVQNELAKNNTLKVVFGYQFDSEYYDSDKLKSNLKGHFENAINNYNFKGGVEKLDLNFKTLAAGYGEHLFNQIVRDIISADIAVFDTSNLNPNVMLEMGVALTWGKRVLPIKKHDCPKPPSDISGQTYADYKNNAESFLSEIHEQEMISMIERAVMKKQRK
ncbi:MAG: hypothetical protein NTY07_19105 [Bacteroidia bacterium]|nr:hypothetical protein [Bacteroidia bacterium]